MNAGNHDVAIDFSNLFMDDSSLGLAKYLSVTRAPENRSRSKDAELDKLYDEQLRERDPEKRKALIRAFEKRLFEQAYQQPLLWWHRIVPSHKIGDGLEDVAEPQPRRRPGRGLAQPVTLTRGGPGASGPPAGHRHAALHPQSPAADDPDADRRRGARVLHAAHRAGRRRRGEAARRRRQRLAGDDRDGAQAARPRQAAAHPVQGLDGRPGDARLRQVDVDRPAGDRGDRDPARTVAGGRDHGDDRRGADRDAAGHAGGAVPRHLDRLPDAHHHDRRAVDPVVLVRHADHADACWRSSTGCRRSPSRRSMSIRSPISRS